MERSNIEVAVRVRPILKHQDEECWLVNPKAGTVMSMVSSKIASKFSTERNSTKRNVEDQLNKFSYDFDYVADEAYRSQTIFKEKCSKIVVSAMQGINGTICAYGQTCSGKTYTMTGLPQVPGLLPCALRDIFRVIAGDVEWEYEIQIAYLEIYNEQIVDLLHPENKNLKIHQDPTWGVDIKGLTKTRALTFNEAITMLEKGQSNRSYRKKQNHERSSRSHTVFRLYIASNNMSLVKSKLVCRHSLLNLVDLAGSERLTDSKYDNSTETGSINKSLFLLSNVISKLAEDPSQHIPYRDSKLTRLLQNSLGGNSYTLVICCVSPALVCFQETLSTLRFGTRARKVMNQKIENCEEGEVAKLQRELDRQKQEYSKLDEKYRKIQGEMNEMKNRLIQLEKQNSDPNISKGPPSIMVKCQAICLVDEDNFQILIKDGNTDFETQCQKVFLSKVYDNLKGKFTKSLHQVYSKYCNDTLKLIIDSIGKTMKKEMKLSLEVVKETYLNMRWMPFPSNSQNPSEEELKQIQFYQFITQQKLKTLSNQESRSKIEKQTARIIEQMYLKKLQSLPKISKKSHYESISIIQHSVNKSRSIDIPRSSRLFMWGSNKDGRLGHQNQHATGIHQIEGLQFHNIALGSHHTVGITPNGEVYGWGRNSHTQASDAIQEQSVKIPRKISLNKKVMSVSAGWGHTLLLDNEGSVYSWGYNQQGQLGQGNKQFFNKPTKIHLAQNIAQIYAGHSHSAIIDTDLNLYTFGCNVDCRLMLSNEEDKEVTIPTKVSLRNVVSVSAGVSHMCAITKDGRLFAGGDGTFGQLGCKLKENVVGAMFMSPISRKYEDDKVERYCPILEVEFFDEQKRAIQVSCGESFTIVLDGKFEGNSENHHIYTFGKAAYHRLGLNTLQNAFEPTLVSSLKHKNIVKISAGCRHALCLDNEGNVYGWGFNLYRQLGTQTEQDAKAPIVIDQLKGKAIADIACGFFHSACLSNERK